MFDGQVSDYFWWYDVCHNKWYYEHTREICGEDCGGFSADVVEWSGLMKDIVPSKITVGSIVKILSSSSDYIPEIKAMIGKECKVYRAGYDLEVYSEDESERWWFAYDELELVQ
jgi:hypothetical protein